MPLEGSVWLTFLHYFFKVPPQMIALTGVLVLVIGWFHNPTQISSLARKFGFINAFNIIRRSPSQETEDVHKTPHSSATGKTKSTPMVPSPLPLHRVKQPYDALLVLDVEATCLEGIYVLAYYLYTSLIMYI